MFVKLAELLINLFSHPIKLITYTTKMLKWNIFWNTKNHLPKELHLLHSILHTKHDVGDKEIYYVTKWKKNKELNYGCLTQQIKTFH